MTTRHTKASQKMITLCKHLEGRDILLRWDNLAVFATLVGFKNAASLRASLHNNSRSERYVQYVCCDDFSDWNGLDRFVWKTAFLQECGFMQVKKVLQVPQKQFFAAHDVRTLLLRENYVQRIISNLWSFFLKNKTTRLVKLSSDRDLKESLTREVSAMEIDPNVLDVQSLTDILVEAKIISVTESQEWMVNIHNLRQLFDLLHLPLQYHT